MSRESGIEVNAPGKGTQAKCYNLLRFFFGLRPGLSR